ncbi:MAG: carboxypeptidase regulatory-like domain-containing protein [Planctomycetes bacterium]|nr:carboxypeptidase regulatory-like domain-containing protein [Planctomycetota bacterium]
MRNNKLVIVALGVVLLLALAGGIYVVAGPGLGTGRSGNSIAGGNGGLDGAPLDGDPLAGADGGDSPLGTNPNDKGTDNNSKGSQVKGPGDNQNNGSDPNNKGTGKTGAGTDNDSTDPDATEPQPEQEWEPVETVAFVHGRVTFKSDGRPAVGAKVTAEITDGQNFGWGRVRPMLPAQDKNKPKPEISGSATTDGAGEYRIELKMKSWQAKPKDGESGEDRAGWAGQTWGVDMTCIVATLPGYAPSKSAAFQLDPESDTEMNLKLAVPAAITGRVIDAETREGIPGATGSLQDSEAWADGGSVPRNFTTDERGYFSLNSLPASTYVLSIEAAGYAPYNGWQGQGRINLSGGGEKNIGDIALMRAATVRGRVISADNAEPIANASIEFTQGNRWGAWSNSNGTSGEDGTFVIEDVEPGSYTIKVRASSYALLEMPAQTIEAGKTLDLGDLKLDHGLTLSGKVTNADGQPVAGAHLRLSEIPEGMSWGRWGQEVGSTESGEDGTYTLGGASIGEWRFTVTADGYANFEQTVKIGGAGQTIDVKLEKGGTIIGRVLDSDGNPVKDVSVSCVSHADQAYSLWKSQPTTMAGVLFGAARNSANTLEDGSFRLENVAAGEYLVIAGGFNESTAFKDNIRVENDREVSAGDIKFGGKGAARITITEDGVPVPTMTVRVTENMGFGGMNNFQGVTDSMGVALIEKIPAGTYYIRTDRDEGTFDTDMLSQRRVIIKVGETSELTVELRPKDGVYLHGKLTMNGKATFADIILIGTGDRADVVKTTKPVEGGVYEFVGLKPGTYVLHARESDSHVTAKATLTLTQAGDFPFDRDFKGYVVSGVVNTPDNSAAQRTSVSVSINHTVNEKPEYAQWLRGRATPDADGKFRLENVTPGTYVISASLEGVGHASTEVTVGDGDVVGLSISIAQNSGSIKVTVSKLNGTPVSGSAFALLSLETPEGSPVDLGENFQGFFMLSEGSAQTIPTVQPGTYTVILNGAGYISERKANVVVTNGQVTLVNMELTAAAELHLTFTNTEVTQAMLDAASIRYFNAQGAEVPRESSVFDAMGQPEVPEAPTLKAKYLNSQVTEVRVKVAGYAELVVPVEFAIGKKIEKQESLIAE